MLYLDAPAGVGLSYSEAAEDYTTNDTHTAHDSNIFLRKWFSKYDAYAKLPFYISGDPMIENLAIVVLVCNPEGLMNASNTTGESYAGVYVPTLVDEVLKGNAAGQKPHLNLKVGPCLADLYYESSHCPAPEPYLRACTGLLDWEWRDGS